LSLAEDAARLLARQRAEQGLPPRVTDAATLSRIAALMRSEELPAVRPARKNRTAPRSPGAVQQEVKADGFHISRPTATA
jgi:hypothetical protein